MWVLVGIYSRQSLLTNGAAEHDVGRRKLKAHALLRNRHYWPEKDQGQEGTAII